MPDATALQARSVLIAGVGNIGSHLAPLLARAGVRRVALIDRDSVEEKNLAAQDYARADVGRPKAVVQAQRLAAQFPGVAVEAHACDLEDLPLNRADVDVILGALDSRRARQVLVSEIAWPLGVPVVDGGVGDNLLGRVQVFVPGPEAGCLECTWGSADYRLLAAEYPCLPGAAAEAPPTRAPAFLGSFTASLMAGEALKLLAAQAPPESYEVAFDLHNLALRRFALRRSPRCRHDHAVIEATRPLPADATFGDLLGRLEEVFGPGPVRLSCRRGLGDGGSAYLTRESLAARAAGTLRSAGFVPGDRVKAVAEGMGVWLVLTEEENGELP